MGDYIKIREFAEQFGLSRQAVYQRIKKDLAVYTKKEGSETLIDTDAAALFASAGKPDNADSQFTVKQTSHADKLIDSLKDQISAKDEQITALQTQITQLLKINQDQFTQLTSQSDKLREQIQHQSDHIMQQSERLSVLLSQQQYLTHTIAADPDEQPPLDEQPEEVTIIDPPESHKTKFWKKLFQK